MLQESGKNLHNQFIEQLHWELNGPESALSRDSEISYCHPYKETKEIVCLDAVFKRAIIATVTTFVLFLSIVSLISTSVLWILFFILCLFGICSGIVSLLLFKEAGRALK